MSYTSLRTTINTNIKTNGNQEITGAVLNSVLNTMVDEDYLYNQMDLSSYISARVSAYISATTGKWASSSATRTFFVPVIQGAIYRIKAKDTTQARYAVVKDDTHTIGATPNYSDYNQGLHIISATKYSDVEIPDDAAFLAVNYTVSNTIVTPFISIIIAKESVVGEAGEHLTFRESEPIQFTASTRLDARISSVNFGKTAAAPNNTWGTTQFIDITDAKVIRFYGSILNTNGNYQGWTGLIFYNDAQQPIKNGYFVIEGSVQNANRWQDMVVPEGAKYLRYTALLTTQSTPRPVQMFYLDQEDIYNPNDMSVMTSKYCGEKIELDKFAYRWMTYVGNAVGGQSSAIYGDYVFIVGDLMANVSVYNLKTHTLLYTLTTGISAPSYWHCNQSQFGSLRYADDDMFPLLYVSMQNDDNQQGSWVAFRIVPTITNDEISSFTITQVQTIHLPVMTDQNCMGHPNIAYDARNNCFWAYHRNNNSSAPNYRQAHFSKFAIPAIWNGSTLVTEVNLTDADILDSFEDDWSMYNAQGGFIIGGKLYIVQGYEAAGYINLRVIDLYVQRKMVSFVDLLQAGVTQEPEGLFYYEGDVYFTTGTQRIMKICFY